MFFTVKFHTFDYVCCKFLIFATMNTALQLICHILVYMFNNIKFCSNVIMRDWQTVTLTNTVLHNSVLQQRAHSLITCEQNK